MLLLIFFVACTFASLEAWFILLSTICTNPRTPMPETQHVVGYNCHGMTVFITHLENAMLHWLIPVEGLFIVLSMLAAAHSSQTAHDRNAATRRVPRAPGRHHSHSDVTLDHPPRHGTSHR